MKKEVLTQISDATVGATETSILQKSNNILDVSVEYVDKNLIDNFGLIPYPISPSKFPFSIVVPVNGRYVCVENNHQTGAADQVRCLVLTVADTSKAALSLLMLALRMAGICGSLIYAEQARGVRITYNKRKSDDGIIVNTNGGDRRSQVFTDQEGEHIYDFLAQELDRSAETIRTYIDQTKYLTLDILNELVERRATKSVFRALSKMRTFHLAKPDIKELSEEEKMESVSRMVADIWLPNFNKETGEIVIPSENTDAPVSSDNVQKQDSSTSAAAESSVNNTKEKTPGLDKTNITTADQSDPDKSVETSTDDVESDNTGEIDEDDPESENDSLASASTAAEASPLPDEKTAQILSLHGRKNWDEGRYAQITELGNQLVEIGHQKTDPATAVLSIHQIVGVLLQLADIAPEAPVCLSNFDKAVNG